MRILVCVDGVGPINDKYTNHGVRFLLYASAVVSFVFKELLYSGKLGKYSTISGYFITKTRPCNIQQFFTAPKVTIFNCFFFDYFQIFAQNIDRGYTLEPPQ